MVTFFTIYFVLTCNNNNHHHRRRDHEEANFVFRLSFPYMPKDRVCSWGTGRMIFWPYAYAHICAAFSQPDLQSPTFLLWQGILEHATNLDAWVLIAQ